MPKSQREMARGHVADVYAKEAGADPVLFYAEFVWGFGSAAFEWDGAGFEEDKHVVWGGV